MATKEASSSTLAPGSFKIPKFSFIDKKTGHHYKDGLQTYYMVSVDGKTHSLCIDIPTVAGDINGRKETDFRTHCLVSLPTHVHYSELIPALKKRFNQK
jgi:hypothetical protein